MVPVVDDKIRSIHQFLLDRQVDRIPTDIEQFKEGLKDSTKRASVHKFLLDNNVAVPSDSKAFDDAIGTALKKKLQFPGEVDLEEPLPPGPGESSSIGVTGSKPEQEFKFPTGILGKELTPVPDLQQALKGKDEGALSKPEETDLREKLGIDEKPVTTGEALYSVGASFNKPFIDLVASAPKLAAIAKHGIDQLVEASGPRVGRASTKPVQEYDAYKMGEWLQEKALQLGITATDDRVEKTVLGGQVPAAFGTALALIMTGGGGGNAAVGKNLLAASEKGLVGDAVRELGQHMTSKAGLAGGNLMGVSEFEQAKAAGASDEEAFDVYLKNVGVGATMAIPLARAFTRINEYTGGGIARAFKQGGVQSLEMGAQGGVQHYLTNKVAQGTYDPKREPFKDILKAVGVQMFVGMVLPGIMGAYSKMTPEQVKETKRVIHEDLKEYENESAQQGPTVDAANASKAAIGTENVNPVVEPVAVKKKKSAPLKKKVKVKVETPVEEKPIVNEPEPGPIVPLETERPSPVSGTEEPSAVKVEPEKPASEGVPKSAGKGRKAGDEVSFEWLGDEHKGKVEGVENGKVKIRGENGTLYRIKESDVKSETFSKIPKKKTSDTVKDLDTAMGKLQEPATPQDAKIVTSQILPIKALKAVWTGFNKGQKLLLGKVMTGIENWTAKKVEAGIRHNNKAIRSAFTMGQNLIGGLGYTEGSLGDKLDYIGNKNAGNFRAHAFHKDMYGIIGSDPQSLLNVHQALDPETWVSSTQKGQVAMDELAAIKKQESGKRAALTAQMKSDPTDIVKIDKLQKDIDDLSDAYDAKKDEIKTMTGEIGKQAEAHLNAKETALSTLIRKTNDFIHDWHHDNGLISDETYNAHKGKYIARLYEGFELTPPDVESAYQSSRPDFNIFKAREDFDKVQQSLIRDPVYATSKRLGQMLQTQALFEYADAINANKDIHVSDTEFPNSTQMGTPGSKPYYGSLTGKYIPNFIAQDIKGFFFANKMSQDFYTGFRGYDKMQARQFLKRLHTVYNPLVQLGNKLSNYSFAYWTGVDPLTFTVNKFRADKIIRDQTLGRVQEKPETTLGKIGQAAGKIINKASDVIGRNDDGRYFHEAMSKGLLGTDLLTTDLKPSAFTKPQNTPQTKTGKIVEGAKKVSQAASEYYGRADDEAKLSAYISMREDYGYSVEEAAREVYNGFQNYATVGKVYDFASKTPVFGNPYIKFKADLTRILKNGYSRKPLTMATYMGSLAFLNSLLSDSSDEDDILKTVRERRPFIPKMPTPFGSIPLVWQTPVGEVNVARFISPYYVYDKGDRDSMVNNASQFLPYQYDPEVGASSSFNDVWLGTYAQVINDKDFRGKSIADPRGTDFVNVETDTGKRLLNRMNYIARSQVPMFSSAQDMYKAYTGQADYYGREKTISQAIINNIIKIQEFKSPQARETLTKEINYKIGKFESLSRDISNLVSESTKQQVKIDSGHGTEEQKETLRKAEMEALQGRIESKVKEQEDIVKELEEPGKLLKNLDAAHPVKE